MSMGAPEEQKIRTNQRASMGYRPKTLRRLSQKRAPTMLESLCFREIVRTLICEGLSGFYSSVGLTSVPWLRRCFLVGEKLFILRILRNPFFVGVSLVRVKRGAQYISLYTHAWILNKAMSDSSNIHISPSASSFQLILFSLLSSASSLQLILFSLLSSAYYLQLTVFSLPSSAYCA